MQTLVLPTDGMVVNRLLRHAVARNHAARDRRGGAVNGIIIIILFISYKFCYGAVHSVLKEVDAGILIYTARKRQGVL